MSQIVYLGGPEVQAPQSEYVGLKRRKMDSEPKTEPAPPGLTRGILADALRRIRGAVAKKFSMPVLSHVMLSAKRLLAIRATDLNTYAEMILPGDGVERKKALEYCVPYGALLAACKGPKNDMVKFEQAENGNAVVHFGKMAINLVAIPSEDFPVHPDVVDCNRFDAEASGVVDMMKKGVVATSDDETRMALTAVAMFSHEGNLRVVSTDSHRLTIYEDKAWEVTLKKPWETPFLLPSGSCKALAVAMKSYKGRCSVSWKETHAMFEVSNLKVWVRGTDGKFPDYKIVIPKETERELCVRSEDMMLALDHVQVTAQDRAGMIKVVMADDKKPSLESSTTDVGSAVAEFNGTYKGTPIELAYNGRYLKDLLKCYSGSLTFKITDAIGPTVVTSDIEGEPTTVIMPMRL